ncbi:MAG: FG-GAP-like repeat-containing protein [Mariprofundaceae bacterium]
MYTGLNRLIRVAGLACLLALTACPATVPPPSSLIQASPAPLDRKKTLQNIAPEQVFASFTPRFADLNQDGHVDLIIGSRQSGVGFRVAWGDGAGHWQVETGPASNIQPRAIAVGDVNHDGQPEVLIGGEGEQHGLQVWARGKNGVWQLHSQPVGEGIFHGLALRDLNADGWPDIAAASVGEETAGGVLVWMNDKKGGWLSGFGPTSMGRYTDLAVADINTDGHQDIVVASRGGFGAMRIRSNRYQQVGGVEIWLGDGSGRWDTRLLPVKGDAESVAVADVNQDGRPDIVAGLFRLGVRLWLARGDGLWETQDLVDDGSWGQVRVADIDDDTHQEIIAASRDGRGIGVWRWQPSGFLGMTKTQAVGKLLPEHGVYFGLDAASVFSDNNMQIAAARLDGTVEVWSNRVALQTIGGAANQRAAKTIDDAEQAVDLFHVSENKVFKTVNGVIEYRIGPDDELSVVLWQAGKPTQNKLKVQPDGTVSLPYFEAAHIAGMTAREVDDFMTRELARYLRHPRVDVHVEKKNSKRVRVFGIGQGLQSSPTGGTIYLQGRETLVDLMSSLGAPAKDADFSRIRLVRNGKTTVLNVQRAIRQSDQSQNAVLDDGDTVVIPSLDEAKRQIYVLGEVKNPGAVSYTGDFHFLDAVSKSGGFTSDAYYPDIRVVRADREVPEIYAVAFDRLLKQGDLTQNMLLEDKDIIIIPADPIANWNRFVRKLLPTVSNITSTITEVNALRTLLRSTTGSNVIINTGGGF